MSGPRRFNFSFNNPTKIGELTVPKIPDKIITGSGVYYVSLDAPLDDNTGDLNLYKIASNYLNNVPLLCSTINENTGDMQQANIDGTGSS